MIHRLRIDEFGGLHGIRDNALLASAALRRTRQVRQFTEEPVSEDDLRAILEVARWSGSSMNRQPWTFIVVRERGNLLRLAELAPNAHYVADAAVAIAIAMAGDNGENYRDAFDRNTAQYWLASRSRNWSFTRYSKYHRNLTPSNSYEIPSGTRKLSRALSVASLVFNRPPNP